MATLEQLRAKDALERLNEVTRENDGFKNDYRAYVERLGPAILMNGLGQALASERAPGSGGAHEKLCDNVSAWVLRVVFEQEGTDLLRSIIDGEQREYVRAQSEALAWLEWHKKFSAAELPRREEG